MKRIIIHWTGGTHTPNAHEKECYHFLVDGKGTVHNGKFKPEDNENCADGKYAAHTGGGNTGSIGVAICGMAGFRGVNCIGYYPITAVQLERALKLCAEICKKYKLPINTETVMTHYEFGKKHPDTSSAGKVDIVYLPTHPTVTQGAVGDFLRTKIKWYYNKI